jgi:hypothetical protein
MEFRPAPAAIKPNSGLETPSDNETWIHKGVAKTAERDPGERDRHRVSKPDE